jgi:hypothetical protein
MLLRKRRSFPALSLGLIAIVLKDNRRIAEERFTKCRLSSISAINLMPLFSDVSQAFPEFVFKAYAGLMTNNYNRPFLDCCRFHASSSPCAPVLWGRLSEGIVTFNGTKKFQFVSAHEPRHQDISTGFM